MSVLPATYCRQHVLRSPPGQKPPSGSVSGRQQSPSRVAATRFLGSRPSAVGLGGQQIVAGNVLHVSAIARPIWHIGTGMAWQIRRKGSSKPLSIQDGGQVRILPTAEWPHTVCLAIAPGKQPTRLVLLVRPIYGVRFCGHRVLCPVVVVAPDGGELSIQSRSERIVLSIEAAQEHRPLLGRVCCLCRTVLLAEEPGWWCRRCGVACHMDCLDSSRKCPACGGRSGSTSTETTR